MVIYRKSNLTFVGWCTIRRTQIQGFIYWRVHLEPSWEVRFHSLRSIERIGYLVKCSNTRTCSRSIRFFTPKKSNFTETFILKNCVLDIQCIVLLAKFKVSDQSGSIFKQFPRIAYTITFWNQRSAIKLPIDVHYHIFIDICCVVRFD
jgi:hypothetical protein